MSEHDKSLPPGRLRRTMRGDRCEFTAPSPQTRNNTADSFIIAVPSQTIVEARAHEMGAPETLGWRPAVPQD